MNSVQLSGTIADRPSPFNNGTGIRFHLRARHPAAKSGFPPGIVHVPCRIFDPSPEQRRILLGGKHRNVRVEVAGRLEQIVSEGCGRCRVGCNSRQQYGNLEMIVNQQGLLLKRVR